MARPLDGQAAMATALRTSQGESMAEEAVKPAKKDGGAAGADLARPDLSKVSARKNLNETAFFFPHLISDADGR